DLLAVGRPLEVERVEVRVDEQLDRGFRGLAASKVDASRPARRWAAVAADEPDAHADLFRSGLELSEAGVRHRRPAPRPGVLDQEPRAPVRRRRVELLAERERDLRAGGHAVTLSGKYGGASRKPTRGGRPARPLAISSAAPRPCAGTNPRWRAATASR